MNFPPVRPLPVLRPWSAPQSLDSTPENRLSGVAAASGALLEARRAVATREAHRYATVSGSLPFDVTTTPQTILAAPQNYRNFLGIRNVGAANIFVDFGRDASTDSTFLLVPNQIILFDTVVPQDDVSVLGAGASRVSISFSNVNFLESEV